ncbi:hypothetical protein A2U01_0019426, partial [Trifolium medium]|nr:hypothetical protein [Trifolium medium]
VDLRSGDLDYTVKSISAVDLNRTPESCNCVTQLQQEIQFLDAHLIFYKHSKKGAHHSASGVTSSNGSVFEVERG